MELVGEDDNNGLTTEDDKVHITCVVNTSPGMGEVMDLFLFQSFIYFMLVVYFWTLSLPCSCHEIWTTAARFHVAKQYEFS